MPKIFAPYSSVRHCRLLLTVLSVIVCCVLGAETARAQGLPGPSPVSQVPAGGTIAPSTVQVAPGGGDIATLDTDSNYRLGTGDKMKVVVYGEDDLSGEFIVNGAGQVQYPLVGQVNAAGMTISEFVTSLTGILSSRYLRDPKVSVQIENYRPFYIMGEVNKPGEYPYENKLSALGAVALAGGYTYRANDTTVFIRRSGSSKEERLPLSSAITVYPGDVVRIAERMF